VNFFKDVDWNIVGLRLAQSGVRIVVILSIALLAIYFIQKFSGRLGRLLTIGHSRDAEIQKRANTMAMFARYFLIFIVVAMCGMMVLKQIGVEIGPILASAGVVGVAVGFGAQNLVQDIIGGFFILVEDQIRVGDVVNIKGKGGLVEKVGLRMIILRDYDGSVHYIRNGQIDIVSNMTKQFANYVIEWRIPYGEDPERVMAIFRQVDEEMRKDPVFGKDILKPLEIPGVEQFTESWMLVRGRTTTKPLRQWDTGREFMRRIKLRLDAANIRPAGPRLQVDVRQNGQSLPAHEEDIAIAGRRS
jgi:small-conductance mechanosensitive channel